ncbi:MAG: TlpA disulfide reductase family protein [Edaphobacter sp.]|uniref:TlpA family protein disulfide reductase n=1 Tax=Edaphobacter sp. TaxID=1934404 RepID=UPI002388C2E4|nr:TlpA disulfide reductase family protein [Edaphobacter sp.]MDE1175230.1 TlpA disulfide reductase family protein [Edaphobacter sp.]
MNRSMRTAGLALILSLPFALPAFAQSAKKAPAAGKLAPDFARKGLDGQPVHLSAYRGKVVLLNFWATWCGPCMAEMPKFSSWQTKYSARGLQVVGISMDDDRAPVDKVYRRLKIAYPSVMGDDQLGGLYGGAVGLPISYLIGTDGKVLARYQGATNLDQMEAQIAKALPKS